MLNAGYCSTAREPVMKISLPSKTIIAAIRHIVSPSSLGHFVQDRILATTSSYLSPILAPDILERHLDLNFRAQRQRIKFNIVQLAIDDCSLRKMSREHRRRRSNHIRRNSNGRIGIMQAKSRLHHPSLYSPLLLRDEATWLRHSSTACTKGDCFAKALLSGVPKAAKMREANCQSQRVAGG